MRHFRELRSEASIILCSLPTVVLGDQSPTFTKIRGFGQNCAHVWEAMGPALYAIQAATKIGYFSFLFLHIRSAPNSAIKYSAAADLIRGI